MANLKLMLAILQEEGYEPIKKIKKTKQKGDVVVQHKKTKRKKTIFYNKNLDLAINLESMDNEN